LLLIFFSCYDRRKYNLDVPSLAYPLVKLMGIYEMKRAKAAAKRKLSQKKSKRGLGCVGSVK